MALLTTVIATGQKRLILDKVIANVGSEYVLYSEVQELFGYAKAQNPTYTEDFQCIILEQIIAKKLLLDQARIDSIVISDIELDVELSRRMDYILSRMEGGEQQFYEIYGRTVLQERERMREPLREELIQQRIQGQLIQNVTITPEETIKFFEKIPKDSLPYRSAEVEIAEITMKTRISDEEKEKALQKLENIRERVQAGENFEELASVYSDDTGSARVGGNLGWAKRGSYVPEFEAAAYELEPGEVSEIVETKFGYHLIQMMQRRGNNINVRHILIRPEETEKDVKATKIFLDSLANLVRVDSISFDLAVKLYSDKDAQSYNNAGRLINPQTGDTFWETKQLPYQVYFAIDTLEVGDLSNVLELTDERGNKEFKVILLQSKTRPHVASLKTDFSWIQQYAKESKKNEYFNKWMENKIASTYIDIIPQYQGCPNLVKYQTGITKK